MPPELIAAPDATTVAIIADWPRLSAEERAWLVELTVGSLGWGSRFGEEFAPVIVGVDASDDIWTRVRNRCGLPPVTLRTYLSPSMVVKVVGISPLWNRLFWRLTSRMSWCLETIQNG